jgi:hypothetical protein
MRAFLLLMLFGSAHAEMLGKAEGDTAAIEIHSDKGVCVGEARRALWVFKDGAPPVVGCWIYASGVFQIAFLDGDVRQIPGTAVKRAEKL